MSSNKSEKIEPIINNDSVSLNSYDAMAEYYFYDVDTKPFNAYYERPATVSLIPDVRNKNVLDAGCAAGWYTNFLLGKGANVTALDFSQNMIDMTRKRVGDKAQVIRADLNNPLHFIESESINVVLSSLTLHYIKSWDTVMSEFNRILSKNGKLIFSVHHPFMDFAYFKKDNYFAIDLINDEWQINDGTVNVQFYRRPLCNIISAVTEAGFVIEKILEPMPTEEFKLMQPRTYEKLTKFPQFLFIRAIKQ